MRFASVGAMLLHSRTTSFLGLDMRLASFSRTGVISGIIPASTMAFPVVGICLKVYRLSADQMVLLGGTRHAWQVLLFHLLTASHGKHESVLSSLCDYDVVWFLAPSLPWYSIYTNDLSCAGKVICSSLHDVLFFGVENAHVTMFLMLSFYTSLNV